MNNFDVTQFNNPPETCSLAPFWFLNGDLDENVLAFQIKEMKDKGVDECILHARKGLSVPYLSEEWFAKIAFILRVCKENDMLVWIYDEDNWPSGYAGGRVVASDPSFRATCLSVEKIYPVLGEYINVPEKPGTELECVIAVHSDSYFLDITDYENKRCKPWRSETLCWEVFVFRRESCVHKPAYSPLPYVDLLNPRATEKFVETTHAEYKKRFPEYWGKTIRGFFTDEPGFYQNYLEQCGNLNTVIWTSDFAERFMAKYGYDIRPHLCCLWQDMGAVSVKTRCDYYQAVADFYEESYFEVISDFLHADGLQLIGHLHREDEVESLVQTESDFFQAIGALDYSGIDCICRTMPRITERLAASAAHTRRKEICFSETFGGFGWSLSLQEMKARTDLQYVQGVNMLVPHAFFYSTDGVRREESPPSLFVQNGYWKYFGKYSEYVKRLSYLGRTGKAFVDTVIYYPTKTSWAKFRPLYRYDLHDLDRQLLSLTDSFNENRINFDFYDDYAFVNVDEQTKSGINVIILPTASVVPEKTLEIIRRMQKRGAFVISCGDFSPVNENGVAGKKYGETVAEITESENYAVVGCFRTEDALPIVIDKTRKFVTGGDAHGVYLSPRTSENERTLLLVNVTDEYKRFTVADGDYKFALTLDAETGNVRLTDKNLGYAETDVELAPYQSVVVLFTQTIQGEFDDEKCEEYSQMDISRGWMAVCGDKSSFVPEGMLTAHSAGIHNYSGEIRFINRFKLLSEPQKALIVLNGRLNDYVRLTINGEECEPRLWSPYEFDITGLLREDENDIEIIIGSTMENEMTGSDIDFGFKGVVSLLECL